MERTYLFVPPEEKSEVQALGARWDADLKRWYIDSTEASARFSRWLPEAEHDEEFTITSTTSYVAAAMTSCQRCHSSIEVICIHCESGTVSGEPLTQFTVSDLQGDGRGACPAASALAQLPKSGRSGRRDELFRQPLSPLRLTAGGHVPSFRARRALFRYSARRRLAPCDA